MGVLRVKEKGATS